MTGPSKLPALLVRLLTEPDLLAALERGDGEVLRRDLTADPSDLQAITTLDPTAVRHYLRLLQRKRLDNLEGVFPGSLPAARKHYGADLLAAEFWQWFQPSDALPADDVFAEVAMEWMRFTKHLAQRGPMDWLGELSRFEVMRWRAVFAAATPATHPVSDGKPVLAAGAGVGSFAVDVPLLLRTAVDGEPEPLAVTTRLITWGDPNGGITTMRLGPSVYSAIVACDGTRTTNEVAELVAAGRVGAAAKIMAMLNELVRAGALRLSPG